MILVMTIAVFGFAAPIAAQSTLDVDKRREEMLKELGSADIPNPDKVREFAKAIFAKPLSDQKDDELRTIATQSNKYANLVSYLASEYESYSRENLRYDFVQKALRPGQDAYSKIGNEFKDYRNQAYFNLGMRAKSAGKEIESLLYFRDAYRLSSFDCGKGTAPQSCMRWKAEQEMQKLLKLDKVQAYVTWQ
jgi:hypothetical protein